MRLLSLISFILILQGCAASSKEPAREFVRYLTPASAAISSEYIADITCKKGDADCNVCAHDVQKQFHDAVLGKLKWSKNSWSFDWNQPYNPDSATPKSIFGSPVEGFLTVYAAKKHVQGFVRTNSNDYPYAGSQSNTSIGGIFVIKKTASGLALSSLHKTSGGHPSGVHILGKYLVYGESGNLVFKDLKSINQVDDILLPVDGNIFGGGLGFTKLENGKYLMIGNAPGGKDGPKKNYFYELTFQNSSPSGLEELSVESVEIPSNWNPKYRLSENNSVISECGSGDIYVVNVSGDTDEKLIFGGRGYWRLSKLQSKKGKLSLKAINHYNRSQNKTSCNSRATGTVSVNAKHKLEFYCHEHGKNINGADGSKYRFQKGTF